VSPARALILDCDGVLAETERSVHVPAFNGAFADAGLPIRWSDDEYRQKLQVSGGRERMATSVTPALLSGLGRPSDAESVAELLDDLHRRKVKLAAEILSKGRLEPRSGVRRLVAEAHAAGWRLAVASTATDEFVRQVVLSILGPPISREVLVLAGDVVSAKKPDPEIYRLSLETLGVNASEAIAVEDSRNGLLAAHAAGLACVVTVSEYTAGESFDEARLVLRSLGDPGQPMTTLANRSVATPSLWLTLSDLQSIIGGGEPGGGGSEAR
jgi:beta-phosphoglucomutase-like phosphatase (HAD superfamily)